MAKLLDTRCCFLTILLMSFALPSLQLTSSQHSFSLQLHLHPPPSYLPTSSSLTQQPLIPYLFADQPLFHFDATSQSYLRVGSARGLYLADPTPSVELRHLCFTATLPNFEGGLLTRKEVGDTSLVMMGNVDSGAISVIGGTGRFAFARGQAKVSMAAAGWKSEQASLSVMLEVELQYEHNDGRSYTIE